MFQERKKNSDYVISIEDLEEVIKILGQPQDFITEEEAENETQTQTSSKKLFRDTDGKYIGGAASGMGYYFGIDTTWIRLLWLLFGLFSAGTIILIYVVLWILIPEAKTTADKLSMKGEPVNIATIEKKFELNLSETDTLVVLLRDTSKADEKTLWEFDRSEIFADEKGEHWWVERTLK